MKRIAILDLGTNTFNLLITESTGDERYKILINRKYPVKLGEGKINKNEIIPKAYARGIEAIEKHFETINYFKVDQIKAFGTSALRSAKNGSDFLNEIRTKTSIEVEIISGDREAELIYLGVRQTLNFPQSKFLIIDIGGGSNELIIANKQQVYWKKSYPLGIARLLEKFHPSNPLTLEEVKNIKGFLGDEIEDLFDALKKEQITTLVGASGSFETFVSIINGYDVIETEGSKSFDAIEISLKNFDALFEKLIHSTVEEREKMRGLEPMRIEMIVLACLFVKFILENHNFERIFQSNFALKEGAIYELLKLQK